MPYRFLGADPGAEASEEVVAGVRALNACAAAQYERFLDLLMSFLISPSAIDLVAEVHGIAEGLGMKAKTVERAAKAWLLFLRGALKHNLSPSHVVSDLERLGLDGARARTAGDKWLKNFLQASQSHLVQTLTVNKLVDMEYTFGVTSSTSELDQVGATFLQMKFVLDHDGEREDVTLEMTLQQFYTFLAQMERAKACVELLSA